MEPLVVPFAKGSAQQRDLLGGKGANLCEMARMGLPVPPGFVITTAACRAHLSGDTEGDARLFDAVGTALEELEQAAGRRLGDPADPLLLSVRSGAPFSMPGMMDTILDLGLNEATVEGLAAASGDAWFAWDAYRRFLQLYGKVVLGAPGEALDAALQRRLDERGVGDASGLPAVDLQALVAELHAIVRETTGQEVPRTPMTQLRAAITAVFASWNGRRAVDYRRVEGIPDDLGTAVTVQAMVFGNLGTDSGSGVAFTRDPVTGTAAPYGDWLPSAQGEDVVSGVRVTQPLAALEQQLPEAGRELRRVLAVLEAHWRDLCDVEFTVERGRFYVLQTRVAKRAAAAAVAVAVDLANAGVIDRHEALTRVAPQQLEQLLHPQLAGPGDAWLFTKALPASPGAAVGAVVFTADDAVARAAAGEDVILVRQETSPEDFHGMVASRAILTARGGLVSHAAVVARGLGKPAVCGAAELVVDEHARTAHTGTTTIHEGDVLTVDGTSGQVFVGAALLTVPEPGPELVTLLDWADEARTLQILANADTEQDAAQARRFGAEGIGLCRTEHQFLGERVAIVRRAILAEGADEEAAALDELRAVQRDDFSRLLRVMDGLPVTVRLLDPPLHEFLPDHVELEVAAATGTLDAEGERLLDAARAWQESNPMLGVRGCRLGVLKPELYRVQVRALLEAALAVQRLGGTVRLRIMIPLVSMAAEAAALVADVRATADAVCAEAGEDVAYEVGVMIETPRAALVAGEIAGSAEFFSFGTNDLTQLTFGLSRDDVEGRLLPAYVEQGLLRDDPFEHLDSGVARLMRLAAEEGRAARADLHLSVCGEHGGDPASIAICQDLGLDAVSCSPFRIPTARLAAAHAALGVAGGHLAST